MSDGVDDFNGCDGQEGGSNSSDSSRCTAVHIHILNGVPISVLQSKSTGSPNDIATMAKKSRKKKTGRRRYTSDEHSTVYISSESTSLLREMCNPTTSSQLPLGESCCDDLDGTVCRLFLKAGHGRMSGDSDDNISDCLGGGCCSVLWAPVILRILPCIGDMEQDEGETSTRDDPLAPAAASSTNPKLYIPPCLAATLGIHGFYTHSSSTSAYLQLLPANDILKASHTTLREIGRPPPIPNLQMPSAMKVNGDGGGDGSKEGKNSTISDNHHEEPPGISRDDEQLRKYFLYPPKQHKDHDDEQHIHPDFRKKKPQPPKPRQRLLTLGSIFAVPSFDYDNRSDGEGVINRVRFYQVIDVQSAKNKDSTNKTDSGKDHQKGMAYIVSPSTHLVLLPSVGREYVPLHPQLEAVPMMNGYSWRVPRPSLVISFLRSVKNILANKNTTTETSVSISRGPMPAASGVCHPSARDLVDALYLQGVIEERNTAKQCQICHTVSQHATPISSSLTMDDSPRIIHVIGKEENHVRACVDEAADIMGMRAFHIDGLAAFWAHYSIFNTYSSHNQSSNSPRPPLTGALPDKLRGLSASLEVARRSSPCVLHIPGIDSELSPTKGHAADLDARREEEQRVLEAIREGILLDMRSHSSASMNTESGHIVHKTFLSQSMAPRIIIVLSTSNSLPPGPISSSLLQSSITISAPDVDYARVLWDNDIDGTFACLCSRLLGLSARDILCLREKFILRWKVEMASAKMDDTLRETSQLAEPSPSAILQSLLPELEIVRSFTQSSGKGGSNNLPLSSSSLPNVRWEDIGGLESIRKEIMDAVELPLKFPELFQGSRRSGILLFGPPGTGKTLCAKAVARECGLPFLSIKGPELLGSYVGESEANIRAVFDAARSAAMDVQTSSMKDGMGQNGSGYSGASVLFFDELDSLAPRRGETGHGDGVMDRVVATLLSELDGGNSNAKQESSSAHVIVIGATNRPDLLDPSLLRPGRFDRLLYLGPAKTKEHCLKILLAQSRKFKFNEGCDAVTVLKQAMESFPPTLSGADLSAVASGALMRGLKRVCEQIEEEAQSINLEKGVDIDSELAVDIDDVMESWSKEKLQPMMTAEDFVNAAKDIVPSISDKDLEGFEQLQKQFSSGQY